MIMALVQQLENSKTDPIIDLGLSKFDHREKFRKFADSNRYELKIHFLEIPKNSQLERVIKRNSENGAAYEFEMTKKNIDFMERWFIKPNQKEISNGISSTK